jgi:CubicO group peptidase (beta-lactamase class C family)
MAEGTQLRGSCDASFGQVREAFSANFAERAETGAAVCVIAQGRVVADLWGGWAGPAGSRPWQRNTLVNVFSAGKGLVAACAARLCSEGLLELDAPVGRYWPEFAATGKAGITVGQLLSHRAGLPAVRRRLPPRAMLDHGLMCAALAQQEPWWEPGTAHGYHANTFGFLVGELVRRAGGRTLGTMLREDIAGPLGADVHIGLPGRDHSRVAEFLWPGPAPPEAEAGELSRSDLSAAAGLGGRPGRSDIEPGMLSDAQLMVYNAYFNPAGLSGAGLVNTGEWRRAEIPSANSHATARGLARVYAALASWGCLDGVRITDGATLKRFTAEWSCGPDLVLNRPSRFGLGFQLTQPERPLGPGQASYGHFGAGGALGFCDPDAAIAFGYVTNSMGPRWQNPRNRALIDAVYASLG